jgi:hypothetical protein
MYDSIIILEFIVFLVFAFNVLYILIFSILSSLNNAEEKHISKPAKKIAVLIPAYKEDNVIIGCVESCLEMNYPGNLYDIVVISDQMKPETLEKLRKLPVKTIEVFFDKSTKSKALNYAMSQLEDYDIAVILDGDNIVFEDFLFNINDTFVTGKVKVLQTHRIAKNMNTDMAYLDALSEEINNSIFRKGHSKVKLSAALIGSGMAFDYKLFKEIMVNIDAIGGFDKALELTLTYNRIRIHYLHKTLVLDEKVQSVNDFSRQRRRWISAQFHYFKRYIKYLIKALIAGKIDFCDKLFQQISIPRIMLIGGIPAIAILISVISFDYAIKWWVLFAATCMALLLAVPRSMYANSNRIFKAALKLPYYFLVFLGNIFHMGTANKTFIHTSHGIKEK